MQLNRETATCEARAHIGDVLSIIPSVCTIILAWFAGVNYLSSIIPWAALLSMLFLLWLGEVLGQREALIKPWQLVTASLLVPFPLFVSCFVFYNGAGSWITKPGDDLRAAVISWPGNPNLHFIPQRFHHDRYAVSCWTSDNQPVVVEAEITTMPRQITKALTYLRSPARSLEIDGEVTLIQVIRGRMAHRSLDSVRHGYPPIDLSFDQRDNTRGQFAYWNGFVSVVSIYPAN